MYFRMTTRAKNSDGEVLNVSIDFTVRASADEGDGPKPTEIVEEVVRDNSEEFVDGIMNILSEELSDRVGDFETPIFTVATGVKQLRTY